MEPDYEILREFEPQPGDNELITRGEYRRMSALLATRLQRIEGLCYYDVQDEKGNIVRPSLETFIRSGTRHIKVMCDWARIIKAGCVGLMALGGAAAGIEAALRVLGAL